MSTAFRLAPLLFFFALLGPASHAAVNLAGPTTEWTSLGTNFDFLEDQQTGQADSDIVGDATDPGFYTTYDPADGFLAFRVRLDDRGGNKNNPSFDDNLWIGIDADLSGSIDAFIGVNTQGSNELIQIYAPGSGSNTSPNTTTIANNPFYSVGISSSNYDYRPVDFTTDGGSTNDMTPGTSGDPDYYVSFQIEFAQVVAFLSGAGIDIDDASPLRYVVATSTQANSLNQDLGGIDGNDSTFDPNTPWEDLGGFTPLVTASGQIVPEPAPALLGAVALVFLLRRRR